MYVNHALRADELDSSGEPIMRYERNKVRTTSESHCSSCCILISPAPLHPEYTVITFVPKNLYEQFRRVANLFFLTLVILQRELPQPSFPLIL